MRKTHFMLKVYHSKKPLRIGYYMDDTYYASSPACHRAVLIGKKALEKRGHEVVPWTPPNVDFMMKFFLKCFAGDAGKEVLDSL